MSDFLKKPVVPIEVDSVADVTDLLEAMGSTAFQARNLSKAFDIWKEMLRDRATIFFGLAGAMIPAGMRKLMVWLLENRCIDCLVSTGANLFHDIHESLGRCHWQGHPMLNDTKLKDEGIDRIYDVLASESEFIATDRWIAEFAATLDHSRPYTTPRFLYLLGKRLTAEIKEGASARDGTLTAAYRAKVPIYCPAIGDSSIGIALADAKSALLFDVVEDVRQTAQMVIDSECTGVIYIGGGTPKNFIQQTEVTASLIKTRGSVGHKYAIQITTDSPQWGGLSGCTFEEAQSWGKVAKKAKKATVYSDATIALPLLVTALARGAREILKSRTLPRLKIMEEVENIR